MPLASQTRAVDVPLANLTIATLQEMRNFILGDPAKWVGVKNRSDKYYIHDSGSWNKLYMAERASSTESDGATWTLSTDSYSCSRKAVHVDIDTHDDADADAQVRPSTDSAEWLANQIRMKSEQMFGTEIFAPSVWTTDWDGVSTGESAGSTVLQWNDSSSDPQSDKVLGDGYIHGLTGKEANVMVVGRTTYERLLVNPQVRAAINPTEQTMLNTVKERLAAYFGVERFAVGGAIHNTAKDGQTASFSTLIDAKSAWFGYVAPTMGLKSLSAYNVFAWDNVPNKAGKGISTYSMEIPQITSNRYEAELTIDIKVVSADCGVFLDDVVA